MMCLMLMRARGSKVGLGREKVTAGRAGVGAMNSDGQGEVGPGQVQGTRRGHGRGQQGWGGGEGVGNSASVHLPHVVSKLCCLVLNRKSKQK